MVYSSQNAAFSRDKQQFFSQVSSGSLVNKIDAVEERVQNIGYTFLLQNQNALETEFTEMFAILQKQKDQNKEAFWLYCYYCASLLEAFYKAYSQQAKEAEYKNIKIQIKARLNGDVKSSVTEESFIDSMHQKFLGSIKSLVSTPFHLSKIRDNVAYANLCRIYWLFCRLTMTQGLNLAKDLKFIDKLDILLGTHTDINKIISVFQAPIGVINYFSVGLFLARFLIDGGLLIKHTFFPTELEKGEGLTTRFDRFKHELYKRHCNFANDLVWATVNFLTNFNQITQISGPVAGYLTAVFLTFDVCMTLYKLHLAKQEYLIKKAQYVQEIEDCTNPAHIELLNKQLIELEISWRTKESNFYFVAAAAALLMLGFTAAMLVSPPLLIMGCFFVCQLAVAMYLSSGAYTQYKEKSLYLEQAQLTGKNLSVAQKDYEIARNDFIFTMIKNSIMPTILITTFAICWPAAIVLTAMYVGYELFHAYNQHSDSNAAKKLALAAPEEEADTDRLLPSPV